jgi:S-adenosylmethionine decarboxylase
MTVNPPFYPGRHLLADLYHCSADLLNNAPALEALMVQAAEKIGATLVGVQFNQFNPIGVSGVVIIAESHLTIHTWPEIGFAAVDFFTCGQLNAQPGVDFLAKALKAGKVELKQFDRGRKLGSAVSD